MKRFLLCFACAIVSLAADKTEKAKLPTSAADLAKGEKLFLAHCARCHGPKGEGSRGPQLAQPKLRRAPDDAALLGILEDGIRGTEMPGADSMTPHEMRQTAAFVRSLGRVAVKPVPGDPAHGAEVFRGKGGCMSCHSMNGDGGLSGPDLAYIGDRRSAAYLRESLVNPSAAVPDGYLLVSAVTRDGRTITGQRLNEDSFSIQIRDNAGVPHSLEKENVEKVDRQRGKSPMPSYQGRFSDTELTDVVAYLASLKESK
jgi:putative heme-binding domain-containing protein